MGAKSEIKVTCTDQVLKVTEAPVLASGGLNEVSVVFTFCEKWKGFAKTAFFYNDPEKIYYAVLDENDTCTVPWEVYKEEGIFYFGVFGEKDTTRRTSAIVRYKSKAGFVAVDMLPSDPTPEVYDQIIAMLGDMRESQAGFITVAEKAIEDANTAAKNAQTATSAANTAAENANTATNNANKAAQSANTAASNANTEAGKAKQATDNANTATTNANNAASAARAATEETNTARDSLMETASEAFEAIKGIVQDGEDAPPIVCSANGKVITVNDSAERMLRGLTLCGKTEQIKTTGKQLLNNGEIGNTKTSSGITFKANADGSVTVNGTATAECYWIIDDGNPINYQGTPLIASVGGSVDGLGIVVGYHRADGSVCNSIVQVSKVPDTFEFPAEAATTRTFLYVSIGKTINNVTIYPMIRPASVTDDAYEPYTGGKASPCPDYPQELVSAGGSGSITAKVCGKNLWDNAKATIMHQNCITRTETGFQFVRGDYTGGGCVHFKIPLVKGQTITASFDYTGADTWWYLYADRPYGKSLMNGIGKITYTALKDYPDATFTIIWNTNTADSTLSNVQVEVGNAKTDYESYKTAQTIDVPTINGLPGIPVDDGWISDEIDLGRGVYVQRVKRLELNGSESWLTANTIKGVNILYLQPNYPLAAAEAGLCTHFPYDHAKAYGGQEGYIGAEAANVTGKSRIWVSTTMTAAEFKAFLAENPVTLLYPMAEPVETALDADLLAEFAKLHSYKLHTTVSNDAGAEMELEYVADTKTYVNNHGGNGGSSEPGADGFSPIAKVEQTTDGAKITITDKTGTTTATLKNGKDGKTPVKGQDYDTPEDRAEIVNSVLSELPKWTGGSY